MSSEHVLRVPLVARDGENEAAGTWPGGWGPGSNLADPVLGLWDLAWVSVSPVLPNTKPLCQHHLQGLLCRLAWAGGLGWVGARRMGQRAQAEAHAWPEPVLASERTHRSPPRSGLSPAPLLSARRRGGNPPLADKEKEKGRSLILLPLRCKLGGQNSHLGSLSEEGLWRSLLSCFMAPKAEPSGHITLANAVENAGSCRSALHPLGCSWERAQAQLGAESTVLGGEGRVSRFPVPVAAGNGAFVVTVCLCDGGPAYLNVCHACCCEGGHVVWGWCCRVVVCKVPYFVDVGCRGCVCVAMSLVCVFKCMLGASGYACRGLQGCACLG